jgi:hypothetical protein
MMAAVSCAIDASGQDIDIANMRTSKGTYKKRTRQFSSDAASDKIQDDFSLSILKRKWWNWQTHHLEGVAPKGVGVQIPPSAPILIL